MHEPRDCHLALVKRILHYIQGTRHFGLQLNASSSPNLIAYSNADWARCTNIRCSTSGYCVYLGDSLISWSSKRQSTMSRSSTEAECRPVANAVAECGWIGQLVSNLHHSPAKATMVFWDNISADYMTGNPVHHVRTKHIELDVHFIRQKVTLGELLFYTCL